MRRVLVAALAIVAGCNAILGIESGVFEPPAADAAAVPADAAALDDEPTPLVDASAPDPGRPEAGACVDLMSNPRHCGRCDHDCGPGACKEGVCEPGVVVTETSEVLSFEVTDTHVFYQTSSGDLRRAPIYGGAAATLYSSGTSLNLGLGLLLHGPHVYFTERDKGRVARCPLTGPCTPEDVITGVPKPYSLARVGDRLFVAEGARGKQIYSCLSLPCASPPAVLAQDEENITRLRSNGQELVWSAIGDDGTARLRALLPYIGTQPRTLIAEPNSGILGFASFAIVGRLVYGVVAGKLLVVGLDEAPTNPQVLEAIGTSYQLEPRDGALWHASYDTGDVYRRPLGVGVGDASVLVVDSDPPLQDMKPKDSGLYWTSGKRVMRLVLP